MSKPIIKHNQPCLNSDCGSSDARQIYEGGTSYCFSCQSFFPVNLGDDLDNLSITTEKRKPKISLEEIQQLPCKGFKERNISSIVTEFFGVKVSFNTDGEIDSHYYPYEEGKAYKVRRLPKNFTWVNNSKGLFGREKFSGGGPKIIITEGEIDAMAVAMAQYMTYKAIYPVVAISSASMTSSLIAEREWLRSFKEIILAFDNDDPGKEATEKAIKILGFDKVKLAKFSLKDMGEVLLNEGYQKVMKYLHNAEPYIPAGIIGYTDLWDNLVAYNSLQSNPFPDCLDGLNKKTKGWRFNEITLFVSGTGAGKSTMLREIILHILKTTDYRMGVVSLEESPAETARKLSGMVLLKNPAKEEIALDELKIGFDTVFSTERVMLMDHQGAVNDLSIMDKLEYMCLMGCKAIFIDHITIMISEGIDNLQGNEAQDKIMNSLLSLVKKHDVWICLVSHLRKRQGGGKSFEEGVLPSLDDIRGSGSVKQISFDVIAFARNLTAQTDDARNKIKMAVLKSRYTGLTGVVNGAWYNYETGRLHYSETLDCDDFSVVGE